MKGTNAASVLVLFSVLAVVVGGCGGQDESTTSDAGGETTISEPTPEPTTTPPATTTEPPPEPPPTPPEPPVAPSEPPMAPPGPPTTTTTVEPSTVGEPFDVWVPVPEEGPILGVVGVRHDDTLNVRSGPGVAFDVVTTLTPTQAGIAGTGEGWQLPSGTVWWKIDANGIVGWVNQRFVSRLGGVTDLTSTVVPDLGGIPVAETMLDLGLSVATAFADVDVSSDIVLVVPPTVGDLGEVTYDVLGLGDDSVGGYRLHVFGQPTDSGEGFSLMAVEATTLCQRGVSGELCV